MLDRDVVQEFLEDIFKENGIQIPRGIKIDELTETFCRYTEDDYYEWLKDNYKSFFESLDWDWIRGRIEYYKERT